MGELQMDSDITLVGRYANHNDKKVAELANFKESSVPYTRINYKQSL